MHKTYTKRVYIVYVHDQRRVQKEKRRGRSMHTNCIKPMQRSRDQYNIIECRLHIACLVSWAGV
jgi:hypothetical protein